MIGDAVEVLDAWRGSIFGRKVEPPTHEGNWYEGILPPEKGGSDGGKVESTMPLGEAAPEKLLSLIGGEP